jgi:predicted nucleic acid-binding protein
MSAAFVVDCSVTMAWLFKDEATTHTTKLLRRLDAEIVLVPSLWFLEVANVLGIAERKGRVTSADSTLFIGELSKLGIEVDGDSAGGAFHDLLPLCREHGLTSYDAVCLELASRSQLPLATLDEPLRKAAKKLGIKLLGK